MEEKKLDLAKEKLLRNGKNGSIRAGKEAIAAAKEYCEGYKKFLDASKTEREAVAWAVKELEKAGFVVYDRTKKYQPGDKVYFDHKHKAIVACVFGKKPCAEGIRLAASHIDSPRLDLKPNPLYEKGNMAYLDTHYYGGIKKYQWVTIPLALHGRVVRADGSMVDIRIGDEPGEPQLCITDLLPHLGQEQMQKSLATGIEGEKLDVLAATLPYELEEGADAVKTNLMALLNEKYGIVEDDFQSAELSLVPAFGAADVGLDRSLVGSYGQDDRVCAYTSLTATMEVTDPEYTSVTILTDREEIGSEGNTGLQSAYLDYFFEDLADMENVPVRELFRNTECLSADVNAAFDPLYPAPYADNNSSVINGGVVVTKYTGSRGKSATSDASAEFMGRVRSVMNAENVLWQVGELGAVDAGGGGTVAKYIARRGIEVVDVGVPVLSMHAPWELVSKLDVYMTNRAFAAFFRA